MAKSKSARAVLEKMNRGPLTFGQMVKAIRETDEMTQEELASRLDIGKSFVSDVENGRRVPSIEKAAEWAVALSQHRVVFVEKVLQEQVRQAGINDMRVEVRAA